MLAGLGFSGDSINPTKKQGIVTYGLVFAMFGAYKLDKMMEMRNPGNCGTNTLCAYKHEWPIRAMAGFLENAEMNEETKELWIELDGSEEDGMFYLASPCKADLTVLKTECKCRKFYDTTGVHSEVMINKRGHQTGVDHFFSFFSMPGTVIVSDDMFTVPVYFPEGTGHEFKYPAGESVTFNHIRESEEEMESITLRQGKKIENPLVVRAALMSMDKVELAKWVESNTGGKWVIDNPATEEFTFIQMTDLNIIDDTLYKKCIKGDWWALWEDEETVDCIKVKADGYPDYEPNFCYERKWDKASKAEVALFAGEVALGVAVGIVASPSGPGSIAAYCGTTTAVSVAGAWLLAGTMAGDKWPHGIDQ